MDVLHKIGASWLECLKMLSFSSLKQIFSITLLKTREIYHVLSYQAWWIIPIYFLLGWFADPVFISLGFLIFVVAWSARSSIDRKNYAYFTQMLPYLTIYCVGLVVIYYFMLFKHMSIGWILKSSTLENELRGIRLFLERVSLFNLQAFLLLMLFFFLDSGLWPKSCLNVPFNACKMMIFNYPLFIIITIFFFLLEFLAGFILIITLLAVGHFIPSIHVSTGLLELQCILLPIFLIFVPFCSALMHTLYLRRAYDQSDLYNYF